MQIEKMWDPRVDRYFCKVPSLFPVHYNVQPQWLHCCSRFVYLLRARSATVLSPRLAIPLGGRPLLTSVRLSRVALCSLTTLPLLALVAGSHRNDRPCYAEAKVRTYSFLFSFSFAPDFRSNLTPSEGWWFERLRE